MFEPALNKVLPRQAAQTGLLYAHGLTTALKMQRIVVALALAAVQAFAPPRLVATPATKSVLPLRSPLRDSALRSATAEETFEQRPSVVPTLQVDAGAPRRDAVA